MAENIEKTATKILQLLAQVRKNPEVPNEVDGPFLKQITKLEIDDINDAVWLLKNSGYVETVQYLDTRDYMFTTVAITALGRYEVERISSPLEQDAVEISKATKPSTGPSKDTEAAEPTRQISLPPAPVGSPYGFTDEDWEFIASQKGNSGELLVVMGYQFKSDHYDTTLLLSNVRQMFQTAVDEYVSRPGSIPAKLKFKALAADYGGHLFNAIARDIIAADIAIFDTSDLNPNVMIELGVALTWGVRVLPIRFHLQPVPPSDISGHTWVAYRDSAAHFEDAEHPAKLVTMVERALLKKGRARP